MNIRKRPLILAAFAAAALTGAALTPLVVRPAAELRADDIDDAVAGLKVLVKEGDANKIIARITELETKPDSRITEEFADIARSASVKDDRVAKTAMKAAAQRKHPELFKWLKGKIDDKKMIEDHEERYLAVLDSLSFYGDKSALKDLADAVKKYLPTNPKISTRAIAAYGSVREKPAVEQLIEWLADTEKTGGGGGSAKAMSAETKKNYGEAKVALLKALKSLTQQDMDDAASWTKWWKDGAKTFEFPDPNAPEIDYATQTAYTDRAYGFTIKKPEAKFWAFKKNETAGGRVTLDYRDESGLEWARGLVLTWKGSNDITNVEQFGKFYETSFREKEFEKFAKDGEPKIEVKKIGGREVTVASARGLAKDAIKAWESCERRVYITQATPTLFLYIDCTIRAGADDAVKLAFWNAFETMTFKK